MMVPSLMWYGNLEVFIRCYMRATLVGYGVTKAPPCEVY
jgi:hypothetical protein